MLSDMAKIEMSWLLLQNQRNVAWPVVLDVIFTCFSASLEPFSSTFFMFCFQFATHHASTVGNDELEFDPSVVFSPTTISVVRKFAD